MFKLHLEGHVFECAAQESVLDALLRQQVAVPHDCRQGNCQSCKMQCVQGSIPPVSQSGLSAPEVQQGKFLSCQCRPLNDMHIQRIDAIDKHRYTAVVAAKTRLAADVVRLQLHTDAPVPYTAGQYLYISREDGSSRAYSIASPTCKDSRLLDLHIRRVPNGRFSTWVHESLEPGARLTLSEPLGQCVYVTAQAEQPLLMLATGTGLAPLYGIVHDALRAKHRGPIQLFHGGRTQDDLYYMNELRELENRNANFHYTPCLTKEHGADRYAFGRVQAVALKRFESFQGWRVYICGNPDMVKNAQFAVYARGANTRNIHCDAFTRSAAGQTDTTGQNPSHKAGLNA